MRGYMVKISNGVQLAHLQLRVLSLFASVIRWRHYRGMPNVCRLVSMFFSPHNSVIVSTETRALKIYLNDPCWVRYVFEGFAYENEIAKVLERALDSNSVFLDCGANIGYWSVYAARLIGAKGRVLAIEPASATFYRLRENSELNGGSFHAVRKAVFSRSGMQLQFRTHTERHAANTCMFDLAELRDTAYHFEYVQSVSIDDLADEFSLVTSKTRNIVVKIDVEGAEIEAFKGAKKLVDAGALFIYEDHGHDSSCSATEFVLNRIGLDVYFLSGRSVPLHVRTIQQVLALKTDPTVGYNLLAARKDSATLHNVMAQFNHQAAATPLHGVVRGA